MAVKIGDTVRIAYVGKFRDGKVFERSMLGLPMEFRVGEGNVIEGLEKAVVGMDLDEQKTVTIPCDEAYGQRRDDLIVAVPKKSLPKHLSLSEGEVFDVRTVDGEEVPATVREVTEDAVVFDANSPLAGKDLVFEIKLIGIDSEEE
jgi:peptidylprolyl isomerase